MKVLKFGAVWCPGCLIMRPLWKEIEKENSWLKTQYFEFDEEKESVKKWKIDKSLPTFVFLDKNEKEIFRFNGEKSKTEIIELINKYKDN